MLVFLGDSITQEWPLADLGLGAGVFNAGRGGQGTGLIGQRLLRDILPRFPERVHILAGINDIAGNEGPMTVEAIAGNLADMADAVRARGVPVIVGTVLPYTRMFWHPEVQRQAEIRVLNQHIRSMAEARTGVTLADYYSRFADEAGLLKADLHRDGLHLNEKGYAVLTALARQVLVEGRLD